MAQLKDIYTTDNGFIQTVFVQQYPELFAKIFGGQTSAKALDMYVLYNWGTKSLVNDDIETCNSIVNAVILLNSDNWFKLFDTLSTEYTVIGGRTATDTETSESKGNNTDTQTGSKVAYNSSEFKDTDKTVNTGNDSKTVTRNTTHTETDTTGAADNVIKEVNLRIKTYRKAVLQTIIDEITLQIFDV